MAKICKHSEEQTCPPDKARKNWLSRLLTSVRLYFLALVGTRFYFPSFYIPSLVIPAMINRTKLRFGLFKGERYIFMDGYYLLTEKQVNDYCKKNGITREVAI